MAITKGRYGDKWRVEVLKGVDKTYCSISDIIDHIVAWCKGIYPNKSWLFFNDGLKQWWEVDSQKYLHDEHGMRDRQLRAYGNTNILGTIYHNKVVGDLLSWVEHWIALGPQIWKAASKIV